jgi:hypothetical protein
MVVRCCCRLGTLFKGGCPFEKDYKKYSFSFHNDQYKSYSFSFHNDQYKNYILQILYHCLSYLL